MRDYIVNKLNAQTVKIRALKQHDGTNLFIEVLLCGNGKEITLIYDEKSDEKSGEVVAIC